MHHRRQSSAGNWLAGLLFMAVAALAWPASVSAQPEAPTAPPPAAETVAEEARDAADAANEAASAATQAAPAHAADSHGEHATADINPLWITPFAVLLLMIALCPLLTPHFWHHHYPKVAAVIAVIGFCYYMFVRHDLHPWLHEMQEYVSFICLLGSLFIISGGIVINVSRKATPLTNVTLLLIGAVIANIFGTTGASMLLIRPYIRINKAHIKPYHIIFFIFIVSNCGGSLTPIGDPPLFLGFLKGIPFWWTAQHLWPMWAVVNGILLAIFFVIDQRDHGKQKREHQSDGGPAVGIQGVHNFLFIILVLVGVFRPGVFEVIKEIQDKGFSGLTLVRLISCREVLMVAATVASKLVTGKSIYKHNEFTYGPIKEVAILFVAIFSTMVPALEYLQKNAEKMPLKSPGSFYFATGSLSSFLDNAPTYLTFLSVELGKIEKTHEAEIADTLARANVPGELVIPDDLPETQKLAMKSLQKDHPEKIVSGELTKGDVEIAYMVGVPAYNAYIVAISLGAVFFGACTYIGNGPNFMVKAIADSSGVTMPSFLGYIARYALPILIPVYVLIWLIFLAFGGH